VKGGGHSLCSASEVEPRWTTRCSSAIGSYVLKQQRSMLRAVAVVQRRCWFMKALDAHHSEFPSLRRLPCPCPTTSRRRGALNHSALDSHHLHAGLAVPRSEGSANATASRWVAHAATQAAVGSLGSWKSKHHIRAAAPAARQQLCDITRLTRMTERCSSQKCRAPPQGVRREVHRACHCRRYCWCALLVGPRWSSAPRIVHQRVPVFDGTRSHCVSSASSCAPVEQGRRREAAEADGRRRNGMKAWGRERDRAAGGQTDATESTEAHSGEWCEEWRAEGAGKCTVGERAGR
jgi:hypothetical protein